jgi:hypothetical protein
MELLQVRAWRLRQRVAWLGEKLLRLAIGGRLSAVLDALSPRPEVRVEPAPSAS